LVVWKLGCVFKSDSDAKSVQDPEGPSRDVFVFGLLLSPWKNNPGHERRLGDEVKHLASRLECCTPPS
jgi:hypothetical protein